MLDGSLRRNPHGRLTKTSDVASLISLLCDERAAWLTGAVIPCDGAETIA
jgi:enoyl-[acyl-carrier protein] reductase I